MKIKNTLTLTILLILVSYVCAFSLNELIGWEEDEIPPQDQEYYPESDDQYNDRIGRETPPNNENHEEIPDEPIPEEDFEDLPPREFPEEIPSEDPEDHPPREVPDEEVVEDEQLNEYMGTAENTVIKNPGSIKETEVMSMGDKLKLNSYYGYIDLIGHQTYRVSVGYTNINGKLEYEIIISHLGGAFINSYGKSEESNSIYDKDSYYPRLNRVSKLHITFENLQDAIETYHLIEYMNTLCQDNGKKWNYPAVISWATPFCYQEGTTKDISKNGYAECYINYKLDGTFRVSNNCRYKAAAYKIKKSHNS